ncbi:hypothetical protein [Streptomyces sp. NRRL S-350]|uniref:hypothetical protein n=1 Tax=Streptomyces sp. NRRL S-350 TaxID=1463902 RepID=UPI00068C3608|nr:hypothetical protein [Streptomyces sp. NRRL S-350]
MRIARRTAPAAAPTAPAGPPSQQDVERARADIAELERLAKIVTAGLVSIGVGGLTFTAVNVTQFATRHGTLLEIAWLLDPLVSSALLLVLYVDGRLSRHSGYRPSGWPLLLRNFAGLATWVMNVWPSVFPTGKLEFSHADPGGVLLHSVVPILVILLAEAAAGYRRYFARRIALCEVTIRNWDAFVRAEKQRAAEEQREADRAAKADAQRIELQERAEKKAEQDRADRAAELEKKRAHDDKVRAEVRAAEEARLAAERAADLERRRLDAQAAEANRAAAAEAARAAVEAAQAEADGKVRAAAEIERLRLEAAERAAARAAEEAERAAARAAEEAEREAARKERLVRAEAEAEAARIRAQAEAQALAEQTRMAAEQAKRAEERRALEAERRRADSADRAARRTVRPVIPGEQNPLIEAHGVPHGTLREPHGTVPVPHAESNSQPNGHARTAYETLLPAARTPHESAHAVAADPHESRSQARARIREEAEERAARNELQGIALTGIELGRQYGNSERWGQARIASAKLRLKNDPDFRAKIEKQIAEESDAGESAQPEAAYQIDVAA